MLLLPLTGYWMILVPFEGFANAGMHIHLMQALGWAMIAIFYMPTLHPIAGCGRRSQRKTGRRARSSFALIRKLVGINLILGIVTVVVATGGAYLAGYLASLND